MERLNLTIFEQIMLERLGLGVETAVTSRELAYNFKTTPRRIMGVIGGMCRKGVPIVATRRGRHKGYFIARNEYELSEYIKPLEAEHAEMMKRIAKLKTLKAEHFQLILEMKKNEILEELEQ
nr:MAG TPA: HTH-type transcriptional regulator [Caudoviricetes sp.]